LALRKLPLDRFVRVLDLGTGSGAVALAIADQRPLATVVATDRSAAALDVARANARRLGLSNVRFVQSDWLDALSPRIAFDLIVSNPPYIAEDDPHLAEGDVRFEPAHALTSGADGLDALRTIIGAAFAHLAAGGWLAVEHGFDQAAAVRELLQQAAFSSLESSRDLSGIPRVAAGRHP
jgi:release factor glutamine methyltransferase